MFATQDHANLAAVGAFVPFATPMPRSVLSTVASPKTTERYVHINTNSVIGTLREEGFVVASAKTVSERSKKDPAFAKHMVTLRHPDLAPLPDGSVPQIVAVNSHDGSSSMRFYQGVFRFICSNGLVVGSTYAREVVRHSGEQAKNLIDRVRALAKNTGPLFAQVEAWKRLELTAEAEREFARLATVLRFGDVNRFTPEQMLTVRRGEDEGRTLWNVMNRVQEAGMLGGQTGWSRGGRALRSGAVKGIDKTLTFNRDLWRLAEEFAA